MMMLDYKGGRGFKNLEKSDYIIYVINYVIRKILSN